MRNSYKGFRQLSKDDFKNLWETAIFVFDANVLLNLYRYQSSTRDDLLKIFDDLSDRIWIPYHVGLEFERNRLIVIADQKKRFSEVRKAVEKSKTSLITDLDNLQLRKRHSLINPDKLVNGYETLIKEFTNELNDLQEKQQGLTDFDPLREKIEDIFDKRVGSPPANQEIIDNINKDGEYRFSFKIPPGFEDSDKDKNEADEFLSGGILYKRKYGDLIVWNQILDHAEKSKTKSLIFITDDNKEDWWQKIKSDGTKVIGPRPELTDEIFIRSGVEKFYMYNPEGFLKYSKELLHTQVLDETIKEVRDVSVSRSRHSIASLTKRLLELKSSKKAVYQWLGNRFDVIEYIDTSSSYFSADIIAEKDNKRHGYFVMSIHRPELIISRIQRKATSLRYEIKKQNLDEASIVIVCDSYQKANAATKLCPQLASIMLPNTNIIIGVSTDIDDDTYDSDDLGETIAFVPCFHYP